MNSRYLDGIMERYFDKSDVFNDVIRLKTKHEEFNSQRVVLRKLVVEKDIESDYKGIMRLDLANTNRRHEHPKRKRDNTSIIAINIDPQYGLFLGRLQEHAKSFAVDGENENGLPVYVKYELTSDSEGESGHEEWTKLSVEQLERIFNPPSHNREVGVDQDRIVNRATQIRGVDQNKIFNLPTQNLNVGVDQNRRINCLTQKLNMGIDQDRVVSHPNVAVDQDRAISPLAQLRNVGVDRGRLMNRGTQNQNVGVDQDQIFNLPTQNLNVDIDQDRAIKPLSQHRNVGVDQGRIMKRATQNLNVGVDSEGESGHEEWTKLSVEQLERIFNPPSQNREVGVDQDRIMNRATQIRDVGVDQDQIFNLPTQNLNVGVDQDQRVNCLTQKLNMGIDQDRVFSHPNVAVDQDRAISILAQHRNVGVDRGRIMNRATQNHNVGVDQDQIFNLPTQNLNVGVDQDRRVNCLTQNLNVGVDRGRIMKRATQNLNVGVDQDRRINCLAQNLNVGIYQDRVFSHPKVVIDQDRAISDPAQHRNVGVNRDRVISRPSQNWNSGVDQDRKIIRRTQNHNVCVHQGRPVTENKSLGLRKVKWKDMADGDDEDTTPTVRVNTENLGRKNGPGNYQAKGDYSEHVNHSRPSKNEKVQGQTKNRNSGVDQNQKIIHPTQNHNVGVHQDRPVTKNKSHRHRKVKWNYMVDRDDEDTKPTVRFNNVNLGRKNASRNNQAKGDYSEHVNHGRPIKNEKVQGDNGLLCRKIDLRGCVDKDHLVRKVKTQSNRKREHIDADVEILDNDAFRQNLSSFVPSNTYHKIMEDDIVECHNFGNMSSAADVFRKKLMNVLIKPFDKDELKRLRDYIRDGSYYHYHPDLEKKMKKYRYKRGKCLNILRGFFYWLQKVSQEGAFKPWKDGRCLAVEPGPHENSTSPHSNRAKQLKRKII
ncbi:hypothetical protein CASFOL_016175 [Castilleja foliolosa]|uniref:Uncharacterized protein n=1 Tax=Castilleja foliolosa TaxID=1961234 RepID=A0ABD3DJI7_9LAMI